MRILVRNNSNSERILLLCRLVDRVTANKAHLGARCTAVDHLWLEAVDKQPGAIGLVLGLVKLPATLVSHGVLVKAFTSCATSFAHSNRCFAETSEEFREINVPKGKPLLELTPSRKVNRMARAVLINRSCLLYTSPSPRD